MLATISLYAEDDELTVLTNKRPLTGSFKGKYPFSEYHTVIPEIVKVLFEYELTNE